MGRTSERDRGARPDLRDRRRCPGAVGRATIVQALERSVPASSRRTRQEAQHPAQPRLSMPVICVRHRDAARRLKSDAQCRVRCRVGVTDAKERIGGSREQARRPWRVREARAAIKQRGDLGRVRLRPQAGWSPANETGSELRRGSLSGQSAPSASPRPPRPRPGRPSRAHRTAPPGARLCPRSWPADRLPALAAAPRRPWRPWRGDLGFVRSHPLREPQVKADERPLCTNCKAACDIEAPAGGSCAEMSRPGDEGPTPCSRRQRAAASTRCYRLDRAQAGLSDLLRF